MSMGNTNDFLNPQFSVLQNIDYEVMKLDH